jgi:hypothetical protein
MSTFSIPTHPLTLQLDFMNGTLCYPSQTFKSYITNPQKAGHHNVIWRSLMMTLNDAASSECNLSPVHFRCRRSHQALYYEVNFRWLLPSLRTCCQRTSTPFCTQLQLEVLTKPSGLFPSRQWHFSATVRLT